MPGDERGTHPMSHHIADQNAGGVFSDWENTEEIAAHVARRKVQAEKPQRALLRRSRRRGSLETSAATKPLQFARHLQFLFHLLVLFAQLASPLLHALLELRVQRHQLRLRAIARRFRAVDSSADNA